MIPRKLFLQKEQSFFLFGARATGKSTLLHEQFSTRSSQIFWIDLLHPDQEKKYLLRPQTLYEEIEARQQDLELVVIDEVQKVPALLDIVHLCIFKFNTVFALTGSSARKLKRGQANLLAGRAFTYHLHPFSFLELEKKFSLSEVLTWGSLPSLRQLSSEELKRDYLRAYIYNYIKEEVVSEQIVRNIEPFHLFLEVAAQCNGEILNYSKIAREATIQAKSVQRYYQILTDTLLGHFLYPYHRSLRKRQIKSPKFYFFDLGVLRGLRNELSLEVRPQSYHYGKLFEHFIIVECIRLNDYEKKDYRLSYFKTQSGSEIDLIIETGKKTYFIEIKSKAIIQGQDLRTLKELDLDLGQPFEKYVFCTCKNKMLIEGIQIFPWQEGIKKIFL